MTTDVISELGDKWWPLVAERFFTAQRANDMWFADELPPTYQDMMRSPLVTQSKFMLAHQIRQNLEMAQRKRMVDAERSRRAAAISRVGKRVKTKRN